MSTAIEWTDETWNPTIGCTVVSEGCRNCYAAREAVRLAGRFDYYRGLAEPRGAGERKRAVFTGKVRLMPDRLEQPLRWRKPRRVFVDSMSDLFHPDVPDDFLLKVFTVMAQSITWASGVRHTYQILTKRPERMADFVGRLSWKWGMAMGGPWRMGETGNRPLNPVATLSGIGHREMPPNVWLGTSVEDQATADERIPHLLKTPAAVRFLSCEPLLGPIDLDLDEIAIAFEPGGYGPNENILAPIHWVIVGGESGPNARPMHPDWARSLRDQCQAAGVPFFFKQWGEWVDVENAADTVRLGLCKQALLGSAGAAPSVGMERLGKKKAGRLLDGREWNEMPELAATTGEA